MVQFLQPGFQGPAAGADITQVGDSLLNSQGAIPVDQGGTAEQRDDSSVSSPSIVFENFGCWMAVAARLFQPEKLWLGLPRVKAFE